MSLTTAPYGSWRSPITADLVARGGHAVAGGRYVGDDIWWLELRPTEQGRYTVRRAGDDGEPVDVLPAPWNARDRVHEYGGGAWTVTTDRSLVFVEFTDQRLYCLDAGGSDPAPLTPEPQQKGADRYAGLSLLTGDDEVWCVRERHGRDGSVTRDICVVPLDGSAADDESAIRSVVAGSHFLAWPSVSPDGRRLAWIAWDHPQMPWDGTELRVADIGPDGRCRTPRTVIGSTTESVLQPSWRDDRQLYVVSDRSGWWNLYLLDADLDAEGDGPAEPRALQPVEADVGGPAWVFGLQWYTALDDGRLLTVRTLGTETAALLDPDTGRSTDLELPGLTSIALDDVRGDRALVGCGGDRTVDGLREVDLRDGSVRDVRLSVDDLPDAGYLPRARQATFTGAQGRDVHAIVYPPANTDYEAPAGELPPYVAFVHGGPTGQVSPALSVRIAYFTSRGIGVVDVNYGGSTGYGRDYRERLREKWGIVDVEDTVTVVQGLADEGLADRSRLAISGGSAGGWTVLASLTGTDVYACGTSYYGVTELVEFHATTHDFESHYDHNLVGPWPDAKDVYVDRAPLSHVDQLACPVLLLQGLDDAVVPPSQAELFRAALVEQGTPHAYIAYEGESHGFRRQPTIVSSLSAELSFYGQVMGFDPPDVPRLELWTP